MPIYEYRCQSCGQEFERVRPFSEAHLEARCPSCGQPSRRLLSPAAAKTGAWFRSDKVEKKGAW